MFCVDLVGCPSAVVPFKPPTTAPTVWTPSAMFASYTSDGTNITIPIASLSGLTVAAAAASTGDARALWAALNKTSFEYFNELTTQPEAMVLRIMSERMQTIGDFDTKKEIRYESKFYVNFPEYLVADEP